MKIIQPLLLLIAALLAASSVHALGRGTPLQNFEDVLVQSVDGKPLTLEQVRKAVVAGAASRQWILSAVDGNKFHATHTRGRHTATVEIAYTTERYSIRYVDSIDLSYGEQNGAFASSIPRTTSWSPN